VRRKRIRERLFGLVAHNGKTLLRQTSILFKVEKIPPTKLQSHVTKAGKTSTLNYGHVRRKHPKNAIFQKKKKKLGTFGALANSRFEGYYF